MKFGVLIKFYRQLFSLYRKEGEMLTLNFYRVRKGSLFEARCRLNQKFNTAPMINIILDPFSILVSDGLRYAILQ